VTQDGRSDGRPVTDVFAFIENFTGAHLDKTGDAINKSRLPDPLGPMIPKTSPFWTLKLTSSNA